ncbi:alpha/beta hydrolase [Arthrobacter sp. AZCC_0090]|uniref:alpha/beta hydrolase n=1 Tax=Arthrobacter sp. AZCC_0090 TaxID=2735881 RepID=UPI00160D938E|nr:alpha/beta hydrolase [Arthrobacter sp. AZCC_0090]MBB6407176.1 acetyl esterase [Arthrobacter sp. AZCC_0090]
MALKPDIQQVLLAQGAVFPEAALTDPGASRAYLDRSRTPRARPTPEAVAFVDELRIDGGPRVRIYRPDADGLFPVIVFLHGGGWVMGDLDMHDATCRKLANGVGAVVLNVDYRLAPEHPYPAALEDAIAATQWIHEHAREYGGDPQRLVLAGTSAGGNLAVAVSLKLRDAGGIKPRLQVLIYPVIDSDMQTGSHREYATGYSLEHRQMQWFLAQYVPDESLRRHPFISPAHATSLAGLPATITITAECDPLRDEAEQFAARLRRDGVPSELTRYDGQIHGFIGMYGIVEDADLAIEKLCRDIAVYVGGSDEGKRGCLE